MVNEIKVAGIGIREVYCLSLFNKIVNKIFTDLKVNDC